MAVVLAKKTLALIDQMVEADQGARYRGFLKQVLPHIGDAYRTEEDGFRSHLGASILGGECARSIWYAFRWTWRSAFKAHTLRLFNRGHLEEARFIALLLTAGMQVYQQDAEGKQYRISWADGHAGGSGDGVVIGIPDLPPGIPALLECKTHGDKSFTELAGKLTTNWDTGVRTFTGGKGVREAKFEHYIQMQTYMRRMGLVVGLYLAVNKNDDSLYAEIITLDIAIADQFLTRGEKLVALTSPPKRLDAASPGFFKCRFCDFKQVCLLNADPVRNCRTCAHSRPVENGQWHCDRNNVPIDKERQLIGCEHYHKNGTINS
jgi:hypothetical protein